MEYRNKNMRYFAVKDLCDTLNQNHYCNQEDVKLKLLGIRTQYQRELGNIETSEVTSTSNDTVYVPQPP